jgi:hypothetical protein
VKDPDPDDTETKFEAARAGLVVPRSYSERRPSPSRIFGVVSTALIQHNDALSLSESAEILRVVPRRRDLARAESVQQILRPVSLAWSPYRVTAIDPAVLGVQDRPIFGTAAGRAVVYGGRIVQGSTWVAVVPTLTAVRFPWADEVALAGTATVGSPTPRILLAAPPAKPPDLGLTAIADRLLDDVQSSRRLNHVVAFRASGARLYWVATLRNPRRSSTLTDFPAKGESVLHITAPSDEPPETIIRFCEDVARHQWLLSTLARVLVQTERASLDEARRRQVLKTVSDQLTRLWIPMPHVDRQASEYWTEMADRLRLMQQWETLAARLHVAPHHHPPSH